MISELKHAMRQLPDLGWDFNGVPAMNVHQDIFTDGSSFCFALGAMALGSWACVSATMRQVIAAGPLSGLDQSNNRAEVFASLVALRWVSRHETPATIWSDSSYAAGGLDQLNGGQVDDFETHEDLWEEIAALLTGLPSGFVQVQHIPGHALNRSPEDLEGWLGFWNDTADHAAKQAHSCRGLAFEQLWQAYRDAWMTQGRVLALFRDLHLDLASLAQPGSVEVQVDSDDDEHPEHPVLRDNLLHVVSFGDVFPVQWRTLWRQSRFANIFGVEFVCRLIDLLLVESDHEGPITSISWFERWLLLCLVAASLFQFQGFLTRVKFGLIGMFLLLRLMLRSQLLLRFVIFRVCFGFWNKFLTLAYIFAIAWIGLHWGYLYLCLGSHFR